jgi:hypothetical protein
MPKWTADEHLTSYVLTYFSQFMTKPEWLARNAFFARAKGPSFRQNVGMEAGACRGVQDNRP